MHSSQEFPEKKKDGPTWSNHCLCCVCLLNGARELELHSTEHQYLYEMCQWYGRQQRPGRKEMKARKTKCRVCSVPVVDEDNSEQASGGMLKKS